MKYIFAFFLFLLCDALVYALIDWKFGPDSDAVFHAYVVEKSQEILIHPPLDVKLSTGSQLCQLYLLPTENSPVPNFVMPVVLDAQRGIGGLHLNESLLYSTRKRELQRSNLAIEGMGVYHLKIFAEDCSRPAHSTRPWTINLVLIPTEQPIWSMTRYDLHINTNHKPGSVVGKVTAYAALGLDENPGQRLGDDTGMCSYAIDDPGHSHFDIDSHGTIRSRVAFEQWTSEQLQFNVTGFDCASPVANRASVKVTVHVHPGCVPGWRNVPEFLDYRLLSVNKTVMPLADLEVCPHYEVTQAISCELEKATLRAKLLWTREDPLMDGVANGNEGDSLSCDLEEVALSHQRVKCGIPAGQSINLLPGYAEGNREIPSAVHLFNGSNQVGEPVGSRLNDANGHRLDNANFTLTFWMKREFRPANVDGEKESVVCISDSKGKNRHHFSVFLRNCKLTVLLRQEPRHRQHSVEFKVNPLYFSQWRYAVDEVCDNSWHHYTILHFSKVDGSTSPNQLQLYIDGTWTPHDPTSLQVTEDYALSATTFDEEGLQPTRLTVGACWHGHEFRYEQGLQAALAGLVLSRDVTLTPGQISCLSGCLPELAGGGQLQMQLGPGQQLTVESSRLEQLVSSARQITFQSPRVQYLPGSRPEVYAIQLSTKLKFKSNCHNVSIPDRRIQINRLPPDHIVSEPILLMQTTPDVSLALVSPMRANNEHPLEVSIAALVQGVKIFPSVELQWQPSGAPSDAKVEYCQVSLCPLGGEDQVIEFRDGESIVLNPTVMSDVNYIIVTTSQNRVTLTGPSDIGPMGIAINNLQWFYRPRSTGPQSWLPVSRCFELFCVAQRHDLKINDQPAIKSDPIQVMFTVRGLADPPSVELTDPVPKSSLSMEEPAEEKPTVQGQMQKVLWDRNSPMSYLLLGIAFTLLSVGILIGAVYACRSRLRPPATESQGQANRENALANLKRKLPPAGRLSARKSRQTSQENRSYSKLFNEVMMTINPMDATHRLVVQELAKKQCVYNPELYDDFTAPMIDAEELHQVE